MKFLELYENYDANDIKVGDYLLINFDNKGDEELVRVVASPERLKDISLAGGEEFRFLGITINFRGGITGYFYDHEIIKKVSKDEVEFYSNVKKYNL